MMLLLPLVLFKQPILNFPYPFIYFRTEEFNPIEIASSDVFLIMYIRASFSGISSGSVPQPDEGVNVSCF